MNHKKWIGVLTVALCATANATMYTSGFANGGVIPDGNVTGWSDTRAVSGLDTSISSVTVGINISGGYNGDLYGYLSYNGALIPLINRIGVTAGNPFGSSGSGFSVTLSDAGGSDIHSAAGNPSGTFQADGRNIDPASSPGAFDTASGSRLTFAGTFNGMDPNGNWTLFFADMSSGGGTSTLSSWDLEITAVPEPVNVALGCFAFLFASVQCVRWWKKRAQPAKVA